MSAGSVEATDEGFDRQVASADLVVVDFWAAWCGPCRAFAPVFEASALARPHVAHLKVDVDKAPGLAQRFSVTSIPTTLVLRDGEVVGHAVGAMSSAQLAAMLDGA